MVHNRTAVLLLLVVYLHCGSAEQAKDDSFVQQFRSLPPADRVAAFGLLTELHALQQVVDEAGAAGAAATRLQQLQQQLHQLLPMLQGSASGLAALQQQASARLAADLAPPAPSRVARALTLVNIGWFVGIVLVVLALFSLVGIYLAALLMLVPKEVYEGLGYLLSLWVLHKATLCAPQTAPYVGLTGLLLFTACVSGTVALHLRHWFNNKSAPTILMGLFTLLYGAAAIRLQVCSLGCVHIICLWLLQLLKEAPLMPCLFSAQGCLLKVVAHMQASLLGTIAVWWAVSALGFTIMVFPFLSVIGFREGMAAPFTASLALMLLFLPFKASRQLCRACSGRVTMCPLRGCWGCCQLQTAIALWAVV